MSKTALADDTLHILMGDMKGSRTFTTSEWEHFEGTLAAINSENSLIERKSKPMLTLPLTQVSGDSFGALFTTQNAAIDCANRLFEKLLPLISRMVVVESKTQTQVAINERTLDDVPFNRRHDDGLIEAADLLQQLKSSKALFGARVIDNTKNQTDNPPLFADTIALLWLEKTRWTTRQRELIQYYRTSHNQLDVAEHFDVSPQYVSNQFKKANLKLLDSIEARWKAE